jgi:hypothetical protein
MNVWVTLRDGAASAEVIGAYATETEAEAAAFRQSQTPEHYGALEVLKFDMDFPIGRQSIEAFIAKQAVKDELKGDAAEWSRDIVRERDQLRRIVERLRDKVRQLEAGDTRDDEVDSLRADLEMYGQRVARAEELAKKWDRTVGQGGTETSQHYAADLRRALAKPNG